MHSPCKSSAARPASHFHRDAVLAGIYVVLVSKWLGHSTFTSILDVYGDYIPGPAVRLNDVITAKPGNRAGLCHFDQHTSLRVVTLS